jgi:hypothetical protein
MERMLAGFRLNREMQMNLEVQDMMLRRKVIFVVPSGALVAVVLGAMASLSAVSAQTPSPGGPNVPPEVMDPPQESTSPPADPSTGGPAPEEPLSKELEKRQGVIEPPRGVDPKIEKPVPEDFKSKTPVLPPPADPGGTPDVPAK